MHRRVRPTCQGASGISRVGIVERPQLRDVVRRRNRQRRNVRTRFQLAPIALEVLDEVAAVLERVHDVAEVVGPLAATDDSFIRVAY